MPFAFKIIHKILQVTCLVKFSLVKYTHLFHPFNQQFLKKVYTNKRKCCIIPLPVDFDVTLLLVAAVFVVFLVATAAPTFPFDLGLAELLPLLMLLVLALFLSTVEEEEVLIVLLRVTVVMVLVGGEMEESILARLAAGSFCGKWCVSIK